MKRVFLHIFTLALLVSLVSACAVSGAAQSGSPGLPESGGEPDPPPRDEGDTEEPAVSGSGAPEGAPCTIPHRSYVQVLDDFVRTPLFIYCLDGRLRAVHEIEGQQQE